MTLQWKREPWRKLYVREEGKFAALPLYVRALAKQLLTLVDDHGRIELGGREPWDVIAYRGGATQGDRRLLRQHVRVLFEEGYLVRVDDAVQIRNFVPAQRRWDRVRGEHDLAGERGSVGRESDVSSTRVVHESSTSGARVNDESCTRNELSAEDSSCSVVASRSDPKRSEREEKREAGRAVARQLASLAIGYLNERLKTKYQADAKQTLDDFTAIVREGFGVDQAKLVIEAKIAEWRDDDEMRKNLRPSTLFRPSNFRRYVVDAEGGIPALTSPGRPASFGGRPRQPEPPAYVEEEGY